MKTLRILTSVLRARALDYAVAVANGDENISTDPGYVKLYSSLWELGGPIIDREDIAIGTMYDGSRVAKLVRDDTVYSSGGPTTLVAAMRAFVDSRLGCEVDIPVSLV